MPNENYFLPSTTIRRGSRMHATSKKELFVAIAYTEFVAQNSFLDASRSIDPSLVKYYFIITI